MKSTDSSGQHAAAILYVSCALLVSFTRESRGASSASASTAWGRRHLARANVPGDRLGQERPLVDFAVPKCDLGDMLLARAFVGLTFLFLVVASVLFGFSGRLHDGRAWTTLALFFGFAAVITVWLWFRDKALLERRVKAGPGAEHDPVQNIVQVLAGLVFLAAFAVPGLDRRFGWSDAPLAVSFAGDVMIAIGFLIVFLTFRENTYTAGTIEVAEGQCVIDSGPYAVVRHPMYAGALVMISGVPLSLGSWWGQIPVTLLVPVLVWRLLREEVFLAENLPGYDTYRDRVRYRLVPVFW